MVDLFTQMSKYFFILLMTIFVFLSFIAIRQNFKKPKYTAVSLQTTIIFLIHAMGYLIIFMNVKKDHIIIMYGCQVVYLILIMGFFGVFYGKAINRGLINIMCMMLTIGFIMLGRLAYTKAVKQFVIVVAASIAALIIPGIIRKSKLLPRISYIYCFAGIAFLGVVLVMGQLSYGAKLAVEVAGFSFQPSEFVKILYVFFIASILNRGTNLKYVLISGIFAGLHVIILVLSKDLGSALIFFMVYLVMIYVATCNVLYFLGGIGFGSVAAVLAYKLFDHVKTRVTAYRDPWSVIDTGGYQVAQSLFAIGTGGFLGLGLYKGLPKSIPVVDEDFIFSAISEELGGFFAISLIILYVSCFICFIRIAMKQDVMFYKMMGVGISVTFAVQTILTIGGAIKFIPSTGVTLPLISYGGSSVLCTIVMFAIMQGLNLRAYDIYMEKDDSV